jgi:ankyrin repeat protein
VYAFDDEWLPPPITSFFDPSSSPGYNFPLGFLEDEVAVAQFANSAQATRKNLDDALMWASGEVDDSCVIKPLVAAGANMNPHNEFGSTPLLIAVQGGAANDVRALLEAGADPNVKDDEGKTPLWTAEQGHGRYYPEIIKLLKAHGAKY